MRERTPSATLADPGGMEDDFIGIDGLREDVGDKLVWGSADCLGSSGRRAC